MVFGGVSINPNETKSVPPGNYKKYVKEGLIEILDDGTPTREELTSLPMSELRKIGYKYGCADTSKIELVEEILKKIGD